MRFDGILKTWNDDRGFGFIAPTQGGADIFVHISAFPVGPRPTIGEPLSFEIDHNREGKKRAVQVSRPERTGAAMTHSVATPVPRPRRGVLQPAVALALIVCAVSYGYGVYSRSVQRAAQAPMRSLAVDAEARPNHAGTPHIESTAPEGAPGTSRSEPTARQPAAPSLSYRCDGRIYCSQMTSCAEATFFLQNCPGVKMDGDGDGVPCEQQWCTGPGAR
jgi:cold shock CspA family protein